MTGWVVPAGCDPVSKTCRGCLKKGHIWADCSDNVEKELVGKEDAEDDWGVEEDEYSAFMIGSVAAMKRWPCFSTTRSS
jgi:hypothetical protein